MANSEDPNQTAPIGAVCSGSTLFASMLNSSVMLGNYLQQTTFSDAFFLGSFCFKALTSWQASNLECEIKKHFSYTLRNRMLCKGVARNLPYLLTLKVYNRGQKYSNIALVLQDK